MAFDIDVIYSYRILQSFTASQNFYYIGKWLHILSSGSGLSCCITWDIRWPFNKRKNAVAMSLTEVITWKFTLSRYS